MPWSGPSRTGSEVLRSPGPEAESDREKWSLWFQNEKWLPRSRVCVKIRHSSSLFMFVNNSVPSVGILINGFVKRINQPQVTVLRLTECWPLREKAVLKSRSSAQTAKRSVSQVFQPNLNWTLSCKKRLIFKPGLLWDLLLSYRDAIISKVGPEAINSTLLAPGSW